MKTAGEKMNLESDTDKDIALNLTISGHYCIPIDKAEKIPVQKVTTCMGNCCSPGCRL